MWNSGHSCNNEHVQHTPLFVNRQIKCGQQIRYIIRSIMVNFCKFYEGHIHLISQTRSELYLATSIYLKTYNADQFRKNQIVRVL